MKITAPFGAADQLTLPVHHRPCSPAAHSHKGTVRRGSPDDRTIPATLRCAGKQCDLRRPTVFLCSDARGVNVRICRDEGGTELSANEIISEPERSTGFPGSMTAPGQIIPPPVPGHQLRGKPAAERTARFRPMTMVTPNRVSLRWGCDLSAAASPGDEPLFCPV